MKYIKAHMREREIVLPAVPKPAANYVTSVVSGDLLFLSGQGPRVADGAFACGKVGAEISADDAYDHARLVGLGLLAAARQELGTLDRVRRIVKVLGLVNAVPTFTEHPQVINGCSDLFVEVFGDIGRHARSAIGVASLPLNISVEIEAVFEIGPAA